LQVVEVKPVIERAAKQGGKIQKIAECLLGDETGTIIFSARNEQGKFPLQSFFLPSLFCFVACY
jgi:ssDNA-binding replication factor A large subunit